MHQRDIGAEAALSERHPQCVEHEIGAHMSGELPPDNASTVGVDDKRKKHHPLPAAQVCEIREPFLVRAGGGEVALDEIWASRGDRIGDGGAPWLAAPLGTLDPVGAHQSLDAAATDLGAGTPQGLPHPPRSIGEVVGSVDLADPIKQPVIVNRALRSRAGGALIVGGRRHAQGPADGLDPEAISVRVDERAHFGRVGSSSPAKNTDAALRISFALRSS
jgi:hypothetical protein